MNTNRQYKLAWLDWFEKTAVTALLGTMILVVFLQVIFRFVLKGSLPWSEELARYVMVWAVFIGASMGAKSGAHIGVGALVKLFPRGWRKSLVVVSASFSVVFCAVVFYLSAKVVLNIFMSGQVSPAMEIPMYLAYAAVPVGILLMGVRFVEAAVIALGRIDGEGKR